MILHVLICEGGSGSSQGKDERMVKTAESLFLRIAPYNLCLHSGGKGWGQELQELISRRLCDLLGTVLIWVLGDEMWHYIEVKGILLMVPGTQRGSGLGEIARNKGPLSTLARNQLLKLQEASSWHSPQCCLSGEALMVYQSV